MGRRRCIRSVRYGTASSAFDIFDVGKVILFRGPMKFGHHPAMKLGLGLLHETWMPNAETKKGPDSHELEKAPVVTRPSQWNWEMNYVGHLGRHCPT